MNHWYESICHKFLTDLGGMTTNYSSRLLINGVFWFFIVRESFTGLRRFEKKASRKDRRGEKEFTWISRIYGIRGGGVVGGRGGCKGWDVLRRERCLGGLVCLLRSMVGLGSLFQPHSGHLGDCWIVRALRL